jgi:hypothetical protein
MTSHRYDISLFSLQNKEECIEFSKDVSKTQVCRGDGMAERLTRCT